jgi:hypothetical protein
MEKVYLGGYRGGFEEHRQLIKQVILDAGMTPLLPEELGPGDEIEATLRAWIDEASIFITILGFRYGRNLPSKKISVVDFEHRYARERKIPCLVYFAGMEHPQNVFYSNEAQDRPKFEAFKSKLRTA